MAIAYFIVGAIIGGGGVALWAREALRRKTDQLESAVRTETQWDDHVRATTSEIMATSQSSLLELTESKLAPIKETLDKFEARSQQLEERRQSSMSAVGEQLKAMAQGQERLRTETGQLVTALRAPHVRGRWGEIQLKRVVELAGMLPHCDFEEQVSHRDDAGGLLRPDMVVRLPGGKNVVVDAKVPISAYLDALDTDDEDMRRAHLVRHAAQVRDHITKLGQKRYWQQFDPAPEFVVMFIDEGLFRAALDHDPSLFEASVESSVVLASPTTLIALLRTVAFGWQQENVAESARSLAKLGREMYDRLGIFAKHFSKVGRSLDTAVGAYNEAAGSLESRLLVTARKFPEHGVSSEALPDTPQVERKPVLLTAPELVLDDESPAFRPEIEAA
jgi:DNA recombination protein RmuC